MAHLAPSTPTPAPTASTGRPVLPASPAAKLATFTIAGAVLGGTAVGLLAPGAGWVPLGVSPWPSAISGAAPMAVSSILASLVVANMWTTPRGAANAVLAASSLHLLGGLFLALFCSLAVEHQPKVFWFAFLAAGVLVLVAKSAVLMRAPVGQAPAGTASTIHVPHSPHAAGSLDSGDAEVRSR